MSSSKNARTRSRCATTTWRCAGPTSTTCSTASSTAWASWTSAPTGGWRCSPRTRSRPCWPTSAACWPGPRRSRSTSTSPPRRSRTSSRDSGARVVFVGPGSADVGIEAAAAAGVPVVIGWRLGGRDGARSWEDWLAASSAAEPSSDIEPRPNLMYTSGTTGRPKGVELPPTMFAGGGTIREHVAALGLSPFAAFGTHLVVGPMYHTGPLSGVRLLAAGIPVVVLGRFDAEQVLQAIDAHRAESTVMVPTHFVRLLALPDDVKQRYDVSSLRLVAHTGAPCPVDVKRQVIEWWGPVLQDAYGATEVGTTCTISSSEWLEHPGSVGRAVPPFRAIVVDEEGEEVPPGTEGRLYFEDSTGRGDRVSGRPGEVRQGPPPPRRLHAGRDRLRHRGRVRVHHRPLQRPDRLRRRQHLPRRGRAGARRAPGRRRRRRHRCAASGDGRGGQGARRAGRSRRSARGRRADRLVPRAAGRLQVPALGRDRRLRRPHADGQAQQAGAAPAVLGDVGDAESPRPASRASPCRR